MSVLRTSTSTPTHALWWSGAYSVPPETDILVNATSVWLAPYVDERLDLEIDTLEPHLIVCDVIMNPPQTHLLRTAFSWGPLCWTVGWKFLR